MSYADRIREQLAASPVVVYMKGTPIFPQCGFSVALTNELKKLNVEFTGVNVLPDPQLRQAIKEFSNWPTLPQLYVKGEFVGGSDIVREMAATGELQQLLTEKGISFSG
jgi:monothiol glutaredoxin